MKRVIIQQFEKWKKSHRRKPLVLLGARQVGKTTSLEYFGRNYYTNMVYLNFEDNPDLKALFSSQLDPEVLLPAIAIETGEKIIPGETLIVFDEIQECPEALTSLKYFNERANEYHICAAGSLLGVKLLNTAGFPVGKVNFLEMFPLTFLEFLDATDESQLAEFVRSINTIKPLPANLHEKLLRYFKLHLYIGGMPEAVNEYIKTKDLFQVRDVHDEILKAYSLDFSKHAPSDQIMKIGQVWNNIPPQLGKENKKFIYSAIRKGARAKDFEIAIQWLLEAGLIYKTYNVSTPKTPLDAYANFDFFKIYLLDVGLLGALSSLKAKSLLQDDALFREFKGAYVENYIAGVLAKSHKKLFYWTSEGKAEVDFVFPHDGINYPLEIKSGDNSKKKSLQVYQEKYNPTLSIRSSPKNLRLDGKLLNCPLYLISELERLIETI